MNHAQTASFSLLQECIPYAVFRRGLLNNKVARDEKAKAEFRQQQVLSRVLCLAGCGEASGLGVMRWRRCEREETVEE